MARSTPRQRARGGSGGAQRLLLGAGVIVILVVTFAVGIAVGRKWAPQPGPSPTAVEPARKPSAPMARRSGLTEPSPERPPQEKLTFYQTLTAPMSAVPAATKVSLPARPEPPKAPPAVDRMSSDRPAAATLSKPDKPAGLAERPLAPRAGEAQTRDWAVQVGVFKDRDQAESVRRPLAASGFDAYLLAVPTDGGETRYKVRVGSFKTREEGARMAERVRRERALTGFVTPK